MFCAVPSPSGNLGPASSCGSVRKAGHRTMSHNIGAFIIRMRFWGPSYYNCNKEPPVRPLLYRISVVAEVGAGSARFGLQASNLKQFMSGWRICTGYQKRATPQICIFQICKKPCQLGTDFRKLGFEHFFDARVDCRQTIASKDTSLKI